MNSLCPTQCYISVLVAQSRVDQHFYNKFGNHFKMKPYFFAKLWNWKDDLLHYASQQTKTMCSQSFMMFQDN